MAILVGVDVGTSGCKALAINDQGQLLATASVPYPLDTPKPGWAEQDPALWSNGALDALAMIASQVDADAISGIGLTGQMHGSVFLDGDHEVIRPALLWCDQRTEKQCLAITERIGESELIAMAGNPALTGFTAPKVLWLRDNEPDHFARVRQVLLPKDYVRFVLTGAFATDVADASGTLFFDVANRTWHADLLAKLEVDAAWMPPAFEGPAITGYVTESASARTGLPKGIPVVAGGGDQAAGGVGCGAVQEGVVSASLGTSGVVFAATAAMRFDPEGRVHTFCHSVPDTWHVMGVMLSAGGALRWYCDELCSEERAHADDAGGDVYDYIAEAAADTPPGAEGLVFLPYLSGERTPHKDPHARAVFAGLSLRHTKAHMSRAVFEGVAFGIRDSVELLRGMGVEVPSIRVTGGGAKSAFWKQTLTDVCQVPMATINIDEGPAFGAAILASVAAGCYGSVQEACSVLVHELSASTPDASQRERYDAAYAEYRNLYAALAPRFPSLAGMA